MLWPNSNPGKGPAMRYKVTEAGHMKDIGGKRRKEGDIVTLNKTEAEFEVLRETIVEHKDDEKAGDKPAKAGK